MYTVCNNRSNHFIKQFDHPQKFPSVPFWVVPPHHPLAPINFVLLSRMSHKWNHLPCSLLVWLSFTEHQTFSLALLYVPSVHSFPLLRYTTAVYQFFS